MGIQEKRFWYYNVAFITARLIVIKQFAGKNKRFRAHPKIANHPAERQQVHRR